MLFDYKEVSIDSMNEDYKKSIELCDEIISEVKKSDSDIEKISKMDRVEQIIDTLDGRTSFLAQVHPKEEIRQEGSKIESLIQNYYLNLALDKDLFEAVNNVEVKDLGPVSYTHLTLPTNREV